MSVPKSPSRNVVLLCTVRGCGRPLERAASAARCAAGHTFDRARSGYWNLLQPQDRRSVTPGDRRDVVAARRRLYERGVSTPLVEALRRRLAAPTAAARRGARGALLDVGCGEGSILAALAAALAEEAHGIDLSAPALALAARSFPSATWVVANADRALPYADGSFDTALSITARRPAAELRRVLDDGGRLLVATPADDDLAELRETVLGEARALGESDRVATELAPWFEREDEETVRHQWFADTATCADLLLATYRGQRASQAAAREGISAMTVTVAQRLQVFRPRQMTENEPR